MKKTRLRVLKVKLPIRKQNLKINKFKKTLPNSLKLTVKWTTLDYYYNEATVTLSQINVNIIFMDLVITWRYNIELT